MKDATTRWNDRSHEVKDRMLILTQMWEIGLQQEDWLPQLAREVDADEEGNYLATVEEPIEANPTYTWWVAPLVEQLRFMRDGIDQAIAVLTSQKERDRVDGIPENVSFLPSREPT